MALRKEHIEGSEVAFRAYQVDENDRIVTFTIITADSEEDAVSQANALADGRTIELWDRGRMIVRLSSGDG